MSFSAVGWFSGNTGPPVGWFDLADKMDISTPNHRKGPIFLVWYDLMESSYLLLSLLRCVLLTSAGVSGCALECF